MKLLLPFLIFPIILSFPIFEKASANNSEFKLKRKKFHWQGKKNKNHYYYDFNGDSRIDAMDVVHADGIDFYNKRIKGKYQLKVTLRKSGTGWKQREYFRKKGKWKAANTRLFTLMKVSENEKSKNNMCKQLDTSLISDVMKEGLACLTDPKKGGQQGRFLAQKMMSVYRGDGLAHLGTAYSLAMKRKESRDIASKQCLDNGQVFNCVNSVFDILNQDDKNEHKLKKAIFHELVHLSGYSHINTDVDVIYACTQCCMANNDAACVVCSDRKSNFQGKVNRLYDFLSLFIFDDYIDAEKTFYQYHSALERIYYSLDNPQVVTQLFDNLPWSREKILEKLYFQFTAHMGKKVNKRGDGELFYSDLLAEVMAKVSCERLFDQDEKDQQRQKNCEIMYLARSIPDSYCYHRSNKESCKKEYKESYSRRKRLVNNGLRIPANFENLE
jgi:hypothetical protein